jgi:hypothetical protein
LPTILDLGTRWGVSGQPHAPAALYPQEPPPPQPVEWMAELASEPVWTQRLEEKLFASAGDRIPVTQSEVRHYTAELHINYVTVTLTLNLTMP